VAPDHSRVTTVGRPGVTPAGRGGVVGWRT